MKLFLLSNARVKGKKLPLEYYKKELTEFLNGVSNIILIPYALNKIDNYNQVENKYFAIFKELKINLKSIHNYHDIELEKQLLNAEAIVVCGGNTYSLVYELYRKKIWGVLKKIINNDIPYIGISAGAIITGNQIGCVKDPPVRHIPSNKMLNILDFTITPHYPKSIDKIAIESHEFRIFEYILFNPTPIIAIKENAYVIIENEMFKVGGESLDIFLDIKERIALDNCKISLSLGINGNTFFKQL